MKMPEQRAVFLPDKANFRRNNWFISRKLTQVGGKIAVDTVVSSMNTGS